MLRIFRGEVLFAILIVLMPMIIRAQTNPAPYNLSIGSYSLNQWASTATAGTYPQSMYFHTCAIANPNLAAPTAGDYTGDYAGSAGPRITGLGLNGFYFATTLTNTPGMGVATLALNSRGRTGITVSFQSRTYLAGNPAGLRLQYRVASNGVWADVPGPVEFVSNGATSASNTSYSVNLSTLTSGLVDNRPSLQLRWKFYSISGTAANSCAILLDEINVSSSPFTNAYISTDVMPLIDYCLTPTSGNTENIAFSYAPLDSFPAGTNFNVELSDGNGSFVSPVVVGNTQSNGSGNQTVQFSQPANTAAGLNYRVRVRSTNTIGNDNGAPVRIRLNPLPINAISISARYKAVWLNWTPPNPCWDEVMIVARQSTFATTTPVGNGSAYTPDSTFGLGTAIGGGYVVYKGTDTVAKVFGLIPDTTYGLTIWTRYRSDWVSYSPVSVITPSAPSVVTVKRKIVQAEYFWNINDPGTGNGTPLIAEDGNFNQAFENLVKSGLTVPNNGRALFNVRVKDNAGLWGPLFSTVINVDSNDTHPGFSLRKVTYAEWFWNNDPGQGNATPMLVFDGAFNQAFEQLFANGNLQIPKAGRSTFNVRVKDRDNLWSPVFTTMIHADSVDTHPGFPLRKVIYAEWFWNADPGIGNATPMLALDGNLNQAFENLYVNGNLQVPKLARSTFNVRVKDRDNVWSSVFTTMIHVDSTDTHPGFPLRKVIYAEWFWNNDPGVGNATPMLALDGNLDQAFENLYANGNLQIPKAGRSTFNVRVKDRDNVWSALFTTVIHSDSVDVFAGNPLRKVTQAEYWWNTDPGVGNAAPMLALDGNLNQAFENLYLSNSLQIPKAGRSTFNVRVKDRDNVWSAIFTTVIHADSIDALSNLFRIQRVKATEYFWNYDPGVGNGTPMQPVDQYANSSFELFSNLFPQTLPNGIHMLGMRSRDAAGNWGPVFKTTIELNAPGNTFAVYTNPGATKICKGTSVKLRAYGAVSYTWFPVTGLNTTVGDSVVASPTVTTTYGVVGNNGAGLIDTSFITVTIADSATIQYSTPLVFCQGDSVVLTSSIPFGNYWSTGSTSQSITVKQTGSITLLTDNECGLTQKTINVVNQTPVLTNTTQNVSCYGGNNGSINVSVASDTIPANYSPGLLISELHTNPSGNDSPFEWVEMVATDYINFTQTPYTVFVSNNSPATSKGWLQGGLSSPTVNSTYAFQISTGTVAPGDVVYVGGSSMAPTGTKLRVINTANTGGDGGIGSANLLTGVLGNGGGIADGVAVFKGAVNTLDSNSIPTDVIFFGTAIGGSALADTSKGFTLPSNDRYAGGHLRTTSYFAPDPLTGYLAASGAFNRTTGKFTTTRTWTTSTTYTNSQTAVAINSNLIYQWNTGSPAKAISNLTAGTYTVTVTSAIGCTKVQAYPVTQPDSIAITVTKNNVVCNGGNNGSASITASGGVAPYSYIWSNSATTSSIQNLTAGNYTVTVTDKPGCTKSRTVPITQPIAITINSFTPNIGNSGTSITIKGFGFTGVNAVFFNNIAAPSFTVSGDTQVVAIVPQNGSTGVIRLLNSIGCIGQTSQQFQYVASFANVHLKMFIEGYYLGNGIMEPRLVNSGVSSNYLEVDTVTAFLAEPVSPHNIVSELKGVLNVYGDVYFDFPGIYIGQQYFIGVKTVNTIETWTKNPVMIQQQTYFDFTQ